MQEKKERKSGGGGGELGTGPQKVTSREGYVKIRTKINECK